MKCANCKHNRCYTEGQNCTRASAEDVKELYQGIDLDIMKAAACTEGRFYNELTRLQESVEFAKLMGVKKVGIAFCIGLNQEVKLIAKYFEKFFDVYTVCCKVCGTPKETLELEQINEGKRESMCNPIMQAKVLADKEVDMCFTVGLCVGHDMLFTKATKVPVSCLVAKDRVLAHNPLGAVYSRYWRRTLGINPEDQV